MFENLLCACPVEGTVYTSNCLQHIALYSQHSHLVISSIQVHVTKPSLDGGNSLAPLSCMES